MITHLRTLGLRPGADLAVVLVAAVAVYVWLYLTGGGLPYVMDNNESFSTLWHARNIYEFGIQESWGLADESFGWDAAAHPYVHTHQGNWPRLFGYLIYLLGARTVESQILVTTFTVGLASITVMYIFFRSLMGPSFALICVFLFLSDYLLFTQWQLVTYRVWYTLFAFLGPLAVLKAVEDRRWLVVIFLHSVALFYFELIFAVYIALIMGGVALWVLWRQPVGLLVLCVTMAAGALFSLGVLWIQLVGYMGVESALKDLTYTFLVRNYLAPASAEAEQMISFYTTHRIAFWQNYATPDYRSLHQLVWSIFSYDMGSHTPFVTFVALAMSVPALMPSVGLARTMFGEASRWPGSLLLPLGLALSSVVAWTIIGRGAGVLLFSVALLGILVMHGQHIARGVRVLLPYLTQDRLGQFGAVSLAFLLGLLFLGVASGDSAFGGRILLSKPDARTIAAAVAVFLVAWALIVAAVGHVAQPARLIGGIGLVLGLLAYAQLQSLLFEQSFMPVWKRMLGGDQTQFVLALAICGAAWTGVLGFLAGSGRALGLHLFLVPAIGAFVFVYLIAPGYIRTGYIERHAPFSVFFTTPLYAVAIFQALGVVRWVRQKSSFPATFLLVLFPLIALCGGWLRVQWVYVQELPPTHYSFLQNLARAPFVGQGFAVGNYAAPVANSTGAWAYYDPYLGQGLVEGGQVVQGQDYVWLADRDSNGAYARPAFYLCMISQKPSDLIVRWDASISGKGCEGSGLWDIPKNAPLEVELLASDPGAAGRDGFSYWAVARLRWKIGVK